MSENKIFKIALVVRTTDTSKYLRELIAKIKIEPNVVFDRLIVVNTIDEGLQNISWLFQILFKALLFVESIFLFKKRRIIRNISETCNIRDMFSKITVLTDNGSERYRLLSALVGSEKPDLIITWSQIRAKIQLELAETANLGLLSCEFSKDIRSENFLAGFWEVLERLDVTKFKISVRTKKQRDLLLQCSFQTRYSFLLNRAYLYKKAGAHILRFVRCAVKNDSLPTNNSTQMAVERNTGRFGLSDAGFGVYFQYIVQTFKIVLKKASRIVFYKGYRWHVVIFNKIFSSGKPEQPRVVNNPPKRFLADPFLIEHESKTYCFVEDFEYSKGRAKISVFEVGADSFSELVTCLEEDHHLSFPYVFKYNGDYYMCPETCEKSQIRLYKAVQFPYKWQLEKVLMDNVKAADTMLFEHNKKWWMLTNIDPARVGDNSSELYIYHSDSPLSQNWIPHTQNPVHVDSTKARNGGLLVHADKLLRLAQRQSFDQYGASVSLFKINELTETAFKEELVHTVEPTYIPNIVGTHHMSGTFKYTALDFYDLKKH